MREVLLKLPVREFRYWTDEKKTSKTLLWIYFKNKDTSCLEIKERNVKYISLTREYRHEGKDTKGEKILKDKKDTKDEKYSIRLSIGKVF